MTKAASRPLGVAQRLAGAPVDRELVYARSVVLTGETAALECPNGRWCLLNSLSLLVRVFGNVTVVLPPGLGALRDEVEAYCARAWCLGSVIVLPPGAPAPFESAHAILNVGAEVRPWLPWTSINSNGWVARVSSGSHGLPADYQQPNPVGALMAASFGVTEVFKRVFAVPHDAAPPFDSIAFSLFDLTTSPESIGPPLPDVIVLPDTLLLGGGAIGNGVTLLLSQLPVRGRLHMLDRQDYADENLGTCVLIEQSGWLRLSKAVRLGAWLRANSNLTITSDKAPIDVAIQSGSLQSLSIDLVLNGVDNPGARRSAQRLWPSVIVDGGINEVGAAVVTHRLDRPDLACLMCWFDEQKVDETVIQSRLTGLPAESLRDPGRALTDHDIEAASGHKRAWLNDCRVKGKTICSVISEAVLASHLEVQAEEGFSASVPFVATAAATLVIAQALKSLLWSEVSAVSSFHLGNVFIGPESSAIVSRAPTDACQCVTLRPVIQGLRRRKFS